MKSIKAIILFSALLAALEMEAQIVAPKPVAGEGIVKEYFMKNLVYPEVDLQQGNNGKVVISLHVDSQGTASHYSVKSTFSDAATPVALHLVKTILWKPALISGLPSDYDLDYEVDFNAKSYKRYWNRHERLSAPLSLEADTSYIIYEYKQLEEVARPYFADGSSMNQHIAKNLKFPAEAKEREIQGTVRLSFIVETDGSISNIFILNSVGGGCDNEAIRLVEETIWIPAERNGKYVRSANMQDITFSIGNLNFYDGNSY